jgi:RNA polymerase sigma factor (sigma-70 family)
MEELNLALLQQGDEREFARLVSLFAPKIYSTCLYIIQNKVDAEDLTQDVLTVLFLNLSKFKGESKLSTWIYRICINKCSEHMRHKSRKKRNGFLVSISTFFHLTNHQTPEQDLMLDERKTILFQALSTLPENQRIAYTLFHMEERTYAEIGEIMNCSVNAVESLMFRAKQNLKKKLEVLLEDAPKESIIRKR